MDRTQKDINQMWTDHSDNYNNIIHDELTSFRVEAWQKQVAAQLPAHTNSKVLDCGCGPAFFTIILAKAGYDVVGIDASSGMLERARNNVKEFGVNAEILEMDCHALDFPDNSFDLVVSRNVTHTLWDPITVYRQWHRVLKPGGILLIFDANWHLPHAFPELYRDSMEREKKSIALYGSDFSGNTQFDENAEFAEGKAVIHPFGDRIRPDWDCGALWALGFQGVTYDRDITEHLWDDKEKLVYGNTPMFMIKAQK